MTAPAKVIDCPLCEGVGEHTVCRYDGPQGCSHVNDPATTCPACEGTGSLTAAEWDRWQAAQHDLEPYHLDP